MSESPDLGPCGEIPQARSGLRCLSLCPQAAPFLSCFRSSLTSALLRSHAAVTWQLVSGPCWRQSIS